MMWFDLEIVYKNFIVMVIEYVEILGRILDFYLFGCVLGNLNLEDLGYLVYIII